MSTQKTGRLGEKFAARFLSECNYRIDFVNYRNQFGEIDIIARKDQYIVFVEVKTRSLGALSSPAEAVNLKKQERLIKTAVEYLTQNCISLQPRFDVIEIVTNENTSEVKKLNHIENAFYQEGEYAVF